MSLPLTLALRARCNQLGLIYVPGEGSPTSKLWLLGEAPGEEEERARRPFVGKSGRFLNASVDTIRGSRADCFVCNVSPVRPPENRWEALDQYTGTESLSFHQDCADALLEQVAYFKPNCIFAMGANALATLTECAQIKVWRGYILKVAESKVVASFRPSDILHKMNEKTAKKERMGEGGVKYSYGTGRITFLLDLKRALEESQSRELTIPSRTLHWDLGQEQSLQYLQQLGSEPEVAFDIETKGAWIDRIAFATREYGISIPLGVGEFKEEIKSKTAALLANHDGLIAQNGGFDMGQLKKAGMPVCRLYADTMVAHHLLYPELPHSLDYLASTYCRLKAPPHAPGWDEDANRGKANALHALLTMEIWKKLEGELKEFETC